MKRPLTVFSALLCTLAVFLAVPGDCLFAQTNFVKYAGNPILPLGNPGEWDDAGAAYAHVSFDGTTHHLWYSGSPEVFTYRIGYASSPDGVNWNKHANNPVLSPSSGFDNVDTWTPMVLFDGAAYQMWYTGNSNSLAIGYATAADPASWTKHTGNPVIAPGGGAWEQNWAFAPIVIRTDTLYHMWYSGLSANNRFQSGYATSTDGLSWSKYSNNPVLPVGAPGEWDAVAAIAGSVIFADGQFQMWYHGTTGDPYSNWKIGYATSPDGVNWTKHSGNPILQPGGGWDAEVAGFPRVIKDGHRYRLWYTGRRLDSAVRLGYAEDFSNAAHVDSVWAIPATNHNSVTINARLSNPHDENLTAKALIFSSGDSVDSVELSELSNNLWQGTWAQPLEGRNYSVGVELNNRSAGYIHNSFNWGVSDQFEIGTIHERTILQEGNQRSYLLYVPAAYTGDEAWPLVINYHGHQSNAANQMEIHSKMNVIADSAHFLVAYPQGLNVLFPGLGTAPGWNTPGLQAAQDDVDFTDGLLYDIKKDFNVDPSRVHATGLSNGSIFAFWLAFNRSDVFASVAGVSGPFTLAMLDSFAAIRPFSVLFMHGTNDPVVNFNGIPNLTVPAPETAAFWVDQNNCHSDTVVTELPDVDPNDGSTVTLIQYTDCDDNTEVLFYRINNGGHGWPGGSPSFPLIGNTNYDINASSEIWNFFKRNPHPGPATRVDFAEGKIPSSFQLEQNYPNPFNPTTAIEFTLPQSGFVTLKVYNLLGEEVATLLEAHKPAGQHSVTFEASALASGLYYYTLTAGDFKQSRKMLLMR